MGILHTEECIFPKPILYSLYKTSSAFEMHCESAYKKHERNIETENAITLELLKCKAALESDR